VSSIDWYDANGRTFFDRSATGSHLSAERERFIALLPDHAEILDAGCGSGRDALAFAQAGLRVTAFDGSPQMVRLARDHTGLPVRQMRFEAMAWREAFDGVWACASLLHVGLDALPDVFGRIASALQPGGVFYASFKHGETEHESNGRRFTDMTTDRLSPLLSQAGLDAIDLWITADPRPEAIRPEWVNALARRL
jgi:SAM-dependent methyltransferase